MLRNSRGRIVLVNSFRKFYYGSSRSLSTPTKNDVKVGPSLEAELSLAPAKQFVYVSKNFHPCVVRVLKNSRSLRQLTPAYAALLQNASVVLTEIDKNLRKANTKTPDIILGKLPRSEMIRSSFGPTFYKMIKAKPSDAELMGFVALLHIFQAQNHSLWSQVDNYIYRRITYREVYNMELALLTAYATKEYGKTFHFPTQDMSKCAVKVLHDLVLLKAQSTITSTEVKQNSSSSSPASSSSVMPEKMINPFEYYLNAVKDDAIFHEIGSAKDLTESKVLENFSLQMHLMKYAEKPFLQKSVYEMITKNHPNQENIPSISTVTQDLLPRGIQLLNSIQNPLTLKSLKSVWEIATQIHFVSPSLPFYKKLYQQVLFSISMVPNQLLNNEMMISSLFHSMMISKFSSSSLVNQICEILLNQGFNMKRYGVTFFNLGLQIGAIDFSMKVMEELLNSNNGDVSDLFLLQTQKGSNLRLFETSKSHLYQYLQNQYSPNQIQQNQENKSSLDEKEAILQQEIPNSVTTTSTATGTTNSRKYLNDLVISLLSFHRDEKFHPTYHKLFEEIEAQFHYHHLFSLTAYESLSLLKCYCHAGRNHPQIIPKLYEKIEVELEEYPLEQLSFLLYSFGRFPTHRPTFFQTVLQSYREKLSIAVKGNQIVPNGAATFFRVLWSLAIINELPFESFQEFESYFYKMYRQTPVSSQLHTFGMVIQIANHLSINFRKALQQAQEVTTTESDSKEVREEATKDEDRFTETTFSKQFFLDDENRAKILAAIRENDASDANGEESDDEEYEILSIEEVPDSESRTVKVYNGDLISAANDYDDENDLISKFEKSVDPPVRPQQDENEHKKRHTLESLQQEENEAMIPELMRNRFSSSSSSSSSSSAVSPSLTYLGLTIDEFERLSPELQQQAMAIDKLQEFVNTTLQNQGFFKRLRQNAFSHVTSSYSHQLLSKVLTAQKIDHDSEKFVPNLHYFVDLYIPYKPQLPWSKVVTKDIIIEFDGPFHFESFNREPTGSTVLKRTQLQSIEDFHFVSIPYWNFSPKMSQEAIFKLIHRSITASVKSAAPQKSSSRHESQKTHAK